MSLVLNLFVKITLLLKDSCYVKVQIIEGFFSAKDIIHSFGFHPGLSLKKTDIFIFEAVTTKFDAIRTALKAINTLKL